MKRTIIGLTVALVFTLLAGQTVFAEWYDGYDGTDPNTMGLWHFDEGTGLVAGNSVAGNDGSLVNGTQWTTTANAKIGSSALAFDGVNDAAVINMYNAIKVDASSFTIEFWLKPDVIISDPNMSPYNNDHGVQTIYRSDAHIKWFSWDAAPTSYAQDPGWPAGLIPQGQWTHFAMTWDEGTKLQRAYINGELASEDTRAGVSMSYYWASAKIILGNVDDQSSVQPFHGLIDELRISNVARTFPPIPEPSMIGVMGAFMALVFARRRK